MEFKPLITLLAIVNPLAIVPFFIQGTEVWFSLDGEIWKADVARAKARHRDHSRPKRYGFGGDSACLIAQPVISVMRTAFVFARSLWLIASATLTGTRMLP